MRGSVSRDLEPPEERVGSERKAVGRILYYECVVFIATSIVV